jgi:gliding motility-associated-like protein
VFTPNGDGRNDLFSVGQQGGEVPEVVLGGCSKMLVYNRWGQKVFESLGANLAWDGRTMAGIPCEPGTYFYVLTVKELEFKGTVQLIR